MLVSLLFRHLGTYRGRVAAIIVLQLLQTVATLYLPTLNADIIDDGVVRADTAVILELGGWMLLITAAQVLCAVTATYLSAWVAMDVGRDIRESIFTKVQTFSSREVGVFGPPSLITRTTNDVQQVQMLLLMSFTLMVTAPIMSVGGVLLALAQDVPLSGLLLVVIPVLLVVIGLIVRRMVPLFRRTQKLLDTLNAVLREQIMGMSVIRAFVRDSHETARFAAANGELTHTQLRTSRLMALMFPSIMFVVSASSVAVIWFGGLRIDAGQMQIGALTAFLSYIMQILMAVMMAMFMFMMIPRAAVCAERIEEVLRTTPSVIDAPDAAELTTTAGRLSFESVEFTYPGAEAPVLSGLSFEALPGQTTAIIGSTGAGKSTLLNLIPRLFDASGGTISVDGRNIRTLTLASLRARIGLVPQQGYLFSGTVAHNLRFGDPLATDEQLWQALATAQAADFIRGLPDGLQTTIDQGGTNFSGGQRQRLAIARALVSKAPILLFDDSFSALDYATDARLRAALRHITRNTTVIVVAQRVSTITGADKILVLDEGRLVGTGSHEELLEDCPTYRQIVASQLAAEAAA